MISNDTKKKRMKAEVQRIEALERGEVLSRRTDGLDWIINDDHTVSYYPWEQDEIPGTGRPPYSYATEADALHSVVWTLKADLARSKSNFTALAVRLKS